MSWTKERPGSLGVIVGDAEARMSYVDGIERTAVQGRVPFLSIYPGDLPRQAEW